MDGSESFPRVRLADVHDTLGLHRTFADWMNSLLYLNKLMDTIQELGYSFLVHVFENSNHRLQGPFSILHLCGGPVPIQLTTCVIPFIENPVCI